MKAESKFEMDHRKAVLSLRWLLIILASYLTLFTHLGAADFQVVFGVDIAFAMSNVVLMIITRERFAVNSVQRFIAVLDLIFVSVTLYFLRLPEIYLYLVFVGIFVLAVLWRDLRLVLFSVFVVSVLFGVFAYFRFFRFELDVNIEQFLTLALFFVVAMFYVFLSHRLMQDAKSSNAILEENRIAEVMVELTRVLSSSLHSDEVLFGIVSRLREVLDAADCSIVRIDPNTGAARMMVTSSDQGKRNTAIELGQYPEMKKAYDSRNLLFMPHAKPCSIIAVPMIAHDSVLGLIYIRSAKVGAVLSEANARFFDVISSTAANALRNAQLFEEVEHRARTDFLTGLPNHRFFQENLSIELGRAQRHNHPLSLFIIDLDFLKEVNDRFGHPGGDTVIRRIGETIRACCREIDFAARYGGEEFTVILPETALAGAVEVADRIRERIAAEKVPGIGSITASIGVSNFPVNALGKEELIHMADQALYTAKNGGRNRVAYFNYQMITR